MNSAQLAAIDGMSYRKVDYWSRVLFGHTPGSGYRRHFSRDEAVRIVLAVALASGANPRDPSSTGRAARQALVADLKCPLVVRRDAFVAISVDVPAIVDMIDRTMDSPPANHQENQCRT